MSELDTNKIMRQAERLFGESERVNNENMWDELSEFMLNNQNTAFSASTASQTDISSFMGTAAGSKRTRRVYDSTALQAVQDLAAAFQGTLTNPATTWSKIRYQDEDLNNNDEAIKWLEKVNDLIHNEFNESNFDTEIAKSYQSYVSLANMAIFHEQQDEDNGNLFNGFKFTSLHLGQVVWAEDKNGLVDTIFRKFPMTAKQILEKWPDTAEDDVRKAMEEQPDKQFDILHAIFPRDKKDVKLNEVGLALPENRPFASIYMQVSKTNLLEEGGYYEFPVYVSRWSTMPGEKYGRGPGHLALPDTRTLNRLKQRGLEAIDLQVRPPIFANQRDVFGQLDLRPGGISVVKDHNGVREFVSQARSDILQFSVEELRNSIRTIFFLDKLLLPPRTETGEMTAFEISQRIEQMQRVLGPTLSRLNSEILQPLILRAFKIMLRAGALPPLPDILRDRGLNVEIVFVNQLARAQQMQDVTNIQQVVQQAALLAQLKPEVVDNIDADAALRHINKIMGAPEVIIAPAEQVEETRQQRAQQIQQQQQLEAMGQVATAANQVGNIQE